MGSFLMSCGVSNRVLTEGTPVHLFFIASLMLDRESKIDKSDCMSTWRSEDIVIEGIQEDCGQVKVDEKYKHYMIFMMQNLALRSAEAVSENKYHLSWKQYYEEKIIDINNLNFSDISKHFNEMLVMLHNKGIAYKSSVQGTTSMMKVSHVDSSVIKVIKNSPIEVDNKYLSHNGKFDYQCDMLKDFNDYLRYVIIKNMDSFNNPSIEYRDFYKLEREFEPNYHALLSTHYPEKEDLMNVNTVIDYVLKTNKNKLFENYMMLMGIELRPSLYAGQDYSEIKSRNYRNVMNSIFNEQKKNLLISRIENALENGEDLDGNPVDEEVWSDKKRTDEFKTDSINKYENEKEIVVKDERLIVKDNVDGYELLNDYSNYQSKKMKMK